MQWPWRSEPFERYEFADLATFNSERSRGIVHTPEWCERMAQEQERFNAQQHALYPDAIWIEPVTKSDRTTSEAKA